MSKIRVNEITDLNDNLLWEASQGVGGATVSTSTGEQTLAEALDRRVIYVDTIADLQALDTDRLEEGQAASVQGSELRWGGGEWYPVGPVNVKAFGAKGDGVTDDLPAIKAAIEFAPETGMTLMFPNGTYYTPRATVTDISSWVLVEKDNIKFVSENRHGATLENIIILARGSYGSKFKLGTSLVSGEKVVTTNVAHDFTKNSYVQLISGINPYSTDAGDWQGGSVNPTHNTRPDALFSEIHRVAEVNNSTSFTLYDEVIYPVYHPDTTGQSVTVDGVDGAYVREIVPVENFVCEGLVFKRGEGRSFRGVYFQRTAGGGMYGCVFLTNDGDDGRHIRTEEAINFTIEGCTEFRNPANASGSSWNSVIIGGGSSDVKIFNNSFYGGSQIIDITPALDSNLLFGSPRDHGPDRLYLTCHSFIVSGNNFTGAGDAFTTHPATYKLTLVDNNVETGSTAFRLRSRMNVVTGNNIRTRRVGISLSAFYDDTTISGNTIRQIPDPGNQQWIGVSVVPMSSEVMNNNNAKRVFITGNVVSADISGGVASWHGIMFRHVNNGTPPSGAFEDFTRAIKSALSDYTIEGNVFENCGILINLFINGVSVINNAFRGSLSSQNHWIEGARRDSVRHTVHGNSFYGAAATSTAISLKAATSISYPYSTAHQVGANYSILANAAGIDVPPGNTMAASGSVQTVHDGLSVSSGGSVRALRAVGNSVLHLHGTPMDGTSRSDVRINYNSGTSNNRLYVNGLHVQEGNTWFYPDNTYSLGQASSRATEVYAANGTINTSDEREKQQARELTEAEQAVAAKLKGMIRAFKWNHAVNKKGEGARWHFGVMAQSVQQVFADHGLDAHEYGLLCYDEWEEEPEVVDEETGEVVQPRLPAGDRYGIRYEQLLAFIISAI